MNQAWRTLALAGGFGLASLSAPLVADDAVTDEPPVQAEKPETAAATAKTLVVPPPAVVPTGPMWVGQYMPGHVHEPGIPRLFWYSAYNPFLDELHAPMRRDIYGGRHARYYAGYRTVYNDVNWNTYYLPTAQCYAPGGYGYQAGAGYQAPAGALANAYDWSPYRPGPYATPYAGYGRPHTTNYGAGYGPASNPATAVPPSGINVNGFRYTGDPAVYSPYGVGSSSYFGAYGSAGY